MTRGEVKSAIAHLRSVLTRCGEVQFLGDADLADDIERAAELLDEVIEPAALATRYPA